MTEGKPASLAQRRYAKINALWPNDPKALPPLTEQEAISAAKRLYRLGTGRAFKGQFKVGTGNRRTWVRNGVFVVNPSKGWHDLVHAISHLTHFKMHPGKSGHHFTHADFERRMIEAVITKGWLDGGLQKAEPTPVDPATVRYQRILARIVSWERKLKRAENALVKLRRTKTYYERKGGI